MYFEYYFRIGGLFTERCWDYLGLNPYWFNELEKIKNGIEPKNRKKKHQVPIPNHGPT